MTAIIPYNASTGSDTAPSDSDGSGTNADWSGTTVTLNETVDFTGVADDGTDYVWVDTPAGSRKLARITAFTGGVSTCTALVTAESSDGTYTADNWYVNGTRQTLDADTTNSDSRDWAPGWTISLASGTYDHVDFFPGANTTWGETDAPIRIEAASGRPIIRANGNFRLMQLEADVGVHLEGVELTSTSGGSSSFITATGGGNHIRLIDVVIDVAGAASNFFNVGGTYANVYARGCYFTGSTFTGFDILSSRGGAHFQNCTFDGQGETYFGNSGLAFTQGMSGVVLSNCLIYDCAGDGVWIAGYGFGQMVSIDNCTIVDNAGDGIGTTGTAGTDYPKIIQVTESVIAYNGGYGINDSVSSPNHLWWCDYNAVYSNTSGAFNSTTSHAGEPAAGPNDITLSADPFTNRASDDYSLNDTAGGGALLKDAALYSIPDGS